VLAAVGSWRDLGKVEVRSLDPTISALSIPFLPFALLAIAMEPRGTYAAVPRDGETPARAPAALTESFDRRALFADRARRRSWVKILMEADGYVSFGGDASGGGGLGLRVRDLFELYAVARGLSLPDIGRSERMNRLCYGMGAGVHVDGDADPRFAFHMGLEVGAASGGVSVMTVMLRWGPRIGLGDAVFLTLLPLSPMIIQEGEAAGLPARTSYRFLSGLQVGGAI
jgi:hypothetical protein